MTEELSKWCSILGLLTWVVEKGFIMLMSANKFYIIEFFTLLIGVSALLIYLREHSKGIRNCEYNQAIHDVVRHWLVPTMRGRVTPLELHYSSFQARFNTFRKSVVQQCWDYLKTVEGATYSSENGLIIIDHFRFSSVYLVGGQYESNV